jgi:secondary thiamine-phosphate synthase enzyme
MTFYSNKLNTRNQTEFIDITTMVRQCVTDSGIKDGICVVYIPHTTAGVTINESADPAVIVDITKEINKIIPFHDNYKHMEGNSAAHIKSSLFGISTQVPVKNGSLTLGTWQGIFFCEFDGPRHRSFYVQLLGT